MFPWHSTRDKAKTVHSYTFCPHTENNQDSSRFWQDQDCCCPRKKAKQFAQKKVMKQMKKKNMLEL